MTTSTSSRRAGNRAFRIAAPTTSECCLLVHRFPMSVPGCRTSCCLHTLIFGLDRLPLWGCSSSLNLDRCSLGSVPAGVLADRVNRTHLILVMQASMMAFSLILSGLARWHAPIWTIFAIQLAIGIANTVQAPAFNASLPTLVPREDIGGAVSLNSAMINGSRIAGPSLAAFLGWVGLDLWQLFLINAATYSFVMIPLAKNHLPSIKGINTAKGWRALTTGIGLARRRRVLLTLLRSMFIFSIVSLPYIGLFPSVARLNLGLAADSGSYKILYIIWGLGAFLGALSVGDCVLECVPTSSY